MSRDMYDWKRRELDRYAQLEWDYVKRGGSPGIMLKRAIRDGLFGYGRWKGSSQVPFVNESHTIPPQSTPGERQRRELHGPYTPPKVGAPYVSGNAPGSLNARRIYEPSDPSAPMNAERWDTGGPGGRGTNRPQGSH